MLYMISHSRDILCTLERGILRYAIPTYLQQEKHLGYQLIVEVDTLRHISGVPKVRVDDYNTILHYPLPPKNDLIPLKMRPEMK